LNKGTPAPPDMNDVVQEKGVESRRKAQPNVREEDKAQTVIHFQIRTGGKRVLRQPRRTRRTEKRKGKLTSTPPEPRKKKRQRRETGRLSERKRGRRERKGNGLTDAYSDGLSGQLRREGGKVSVRRLTEGGTKERGKTKFENSLRIKALGRNARWKLYIFVTIKGLTGGESLHDPQGPRRSSSGTATEKKSKGGKEEARARHERGEISEPKSFGQSALEKGGALGVVRLRTKNRAERTLHKRGVRRRLRNSDGFNL